MTATLFIHVLLDSMNPHKKQLAQHALSCRWRLVANTHSLLRLLDNPPMYIAPCHANQQPPHLVSLEPPTSSRPHLFHPVAFYGVGLPHHCMSLPVWTALWAIHSHCSILSLTRITFPAPIFSRSSLSLFWLESNICSNTDKIQRLVRHHNQKIHKRKNKKHWYLLKWMMWVFDLSTSVVLQKPAHVHHLHRVSILHWLALTKTEILQYHRIYSRSAVHFC